MKPALLPGLALCASLVACSDNPNIIGSGNGTLARDDVTIDAIPTPEDPDGATIDAVPTPSDPDGAAVDAGPAPTGPDDIVTTAAGAGNFTTLAAALQATGLDAVLGDRNATFTVFAPTDAAFAKLGDEAVAALFNDIDALSDTLLYHVLTDTVMEAATAFSLAGRSVTTANEDDVAISRDGDRLFINASEVIDADIGASNGVIHAIDTVLTPPVDMDEAGDRATLNIVETAAAAGNFGTLVAALQATGLDAVLADPDTTFTVFAPTDAAFAALGQDTLDALLADPETLSDILLYHVITGRAVDAATAISLAGDSVVTANGGAAALSLRDGELFIDGSRVIVTDIVTTNGIVHAIDAVLTPPAGTVDADGEGAGPGTILDVVREAGFTSLVAAIEAAGLDTALGHPDDDYTLFAPTDAAFAALGQDTLDALFADPDKLGDILRFHILPGNVLPSAALSDILGFDIRTGNGSVVVFSEDDGHLMVNGACIVTTDLAATNGVVHVIDAVLLPPTDG